MYNNHLFENIDKSIFSDKDKPVKDVFSDIEQSVSTDEGKYNPETDSSELAAYINKKFKKDDGDLDENAITSALEWISEDHHDLDFVAQMIQTLQDDPELFEKYISNEEQFVPSNSGADEENGEEHEDDPSGPSSDTGSEQEANDGITWYIPTKIYTKHRKGQDNADRDEAYATNVNKVIGELIKAGAIEKKDITRERLPQSMKSEQTGVFGFKLHIPADKMTDEVKAILDSDENAEFKNKSLKVGSDEYDILNSEEDLKESDDLSKKEKTKVLWGEIKRLCDNEDILKQANNKIIRDILDNPKSNEYKALTQYSDNKKLMNKLAMKILEDCGMDKSEMLKSYNGDSEVRTKDGVLSGLNGDIYMPSEWGSTDDVGMWKRSLITDFGFPMINFKSKTMKRIARSKDRKSVKENLKALIAEIKTQPQICEALGIPSGNGKVGFLNVFKSFNNVYKNIKKLYKADGIDAVHNYIKTYDIEDIMEGNRATISSYVIPSAASAQYESILNAFWKNPLMEDHCKMMAKQIIMEADAASAYEQAKHLDHAFGGGGGYSGSQGFGGMTSQPMRGEQHMYSYYNGSLHSADPVGTVTSGADAGDIAAKAGSGVAKKAAVHKAIPKHQDGDINGSIPESQPNVGNNFDSTINGYDNNLASPGNQILPVDHSGAADAASGATDAASSAADASGVAAAAKGIGSAIATHPIAAGAVGLAAVAAIYGFATHNNRVDANVDPAASKIKKLDKGLKYEYLHQFFVPINPATESGMNAYVKYLQEQDLNLMLSKLEPYKKDLIAKEQISNEPRDTSNDEEMMHKDNKAKDLKHTPPTEKPTVDAVGNLGKSAVMEAGLLKKVKEKLIGSKGDSQDPLEAKNNAQANPEQSRKAAVRLLRDYIKTFHTPPFLLFAPNPQLNEDLIITKESVKGGYLVRSKFQGHDVGYFVPTSLAKDLFSAG